MYYFKDIDNLEKLRKYGFKKGNEWPGYHDIICNDYQYEYYYLFPLDPDEEDEVIWTIDDNHTQWSVQVRSSDGCIWIDCEPYVTYHIDNSDMEPMFYQLGRMIMDGLVKDDYTSDE